MDSVPRNFQLKCLHKELQNLSKSDCFFQFRTIVEPEECFTTVDGNFYPLSLASLASAFHTAYDSVRNTARLIDKANEMKKVTEIAEGLKNEELKTEDGLILLQLLPNKPR